MKNESSQAAGIAESFRNIVRWGLYPASWLLLLAIYFGVSAYQVDQRIAWTIYVAILAVSYLVIERVVPYEKRWSMTLGSFLNDMKYLIVNGATLAFFSTVLSIYAITISGELTGPAGEWPAYLQLLSIILIFEAVQYSIHRLQHEMGGKIGSFLWKTHAAHHLPDRVYILMHVAGHPINAILTQGIAIIIPIWIMGYDQEVVTVFLMINSMHGLISHFNVDVRMGWMNYIFVGPELHRYHHSANIDEAKNYGATTPLFDLLFGTFVYRPARPPEALGIFEPEAYPKYGELKKVLYLPFKRN